MIRTTITTAAGSAIVPPPGVSAALDRVGQMIEAYLGNLTEQFHITANWTVRPRHGGADAELVLTADGGIRTRMRAFTARELAGPDTPEPLLLAVSDLAGQLMRHLDQTMRAREARIRQLEEALAAMPEDA